MRSVEVEGGSIDDAIARALRALGASRDQVEIDILENATRGLLGLGRRRARVRATMRAPFALASLAVPAETDGSVPTSAAAFADGSAATSASGFADGSGQLPVSSGASIAAPARGHDGPLDIVAFLEGALQRMGVATRAHAGAVADGACTLRIDGDDARLRTICTHEVIGALELVVNRVADRHIADGTRFTIALARGDGDDLPRRARRVAERVRRHRRPVTIDVADEHAQRAWTNALRGERGVDVRTAADGERRKLIVVPRGRGRGGATADR